MNKKVFFFIFHFMCQENKNKYATFDHFWMKYKSLGSLGTTLVFTNKGKLFWFDFHYRQICLKKETLYVEAFVSMKNIVICPT